VRAAGTLPSSRNTPRPLRQSFSNTPPACKDSSCAKRCRRLLRQSKWCSAWS